MKSKKIFVAILGVFVIVIWSFVIFGLTTYEKGGLAALILNPRRILYPNEPDPPLNPRRILYPNEPEGPIPVIH